MSRQPGMLKARAGISLFFFTNGAIFAGVLPRYPEIKELLSLSAAQFGFMVIAGSIGSMMSLNLPACFIRKLGARAASLWWTVALVVAVGLEGLAIQLGSIWLLMALMFLAGLADGIVDMAQNTHAMRVQDAYGKSIINSLHALWSAGCIVGGLVGTAAAALKVPLYVHLPIASLALLGIAALAVRLSRIPETTTPAARATAASSAPRTGGRFITLIPLAIIGVAGIQIEIVGNDWSANYMDGPVGWLTSDAGIAYVVMVSAQFVGRFLGDPMVDRFGRVRMARAGFLMSSIGFALAAAFPYAWATLPAFALAGFGCATIVPAVYAAADAAPGFREGTALTVVGWIMRLGNLVTSPLIGLIADASTLRFGILVPLVLGAVAQLYMRRLNYEAEPAEAVAQALLAEEQVALKK